MAAASPKDAFASDRGFSSYLELFEASTALRSVDGKNWFVTAQKGGQWIVWNEQELKIAGAYESLETASESVPAA